MIHLYLDENVDVLLATLLHARGIRVTTTLEAKNLHASDDYQLAYALSIGAAIVTHNRDDFQKLYADYVVQGKKSAGIIIIEYRSVYELARRIVALLSDNEDLSNKLLRA